MNAPALLNGLVALLIEQLGHPSYHYRQSADRALHALAPIAQVQLEQATKQADAEIAHRAWRIWAPYREKHLERVAFNLRTAWPWIHMHNQHELCDWLERAKERWPELPTGGPEWCEWRAAAKLWAKSRLLAGDPVTLIRSELDRMAEEERRWKLAYQNPPP